MPKINGRRGRTNFNEIETKCFCPKCQKSHTKAIHWTGRGVARKFCSSCKVLVNQIDDISIAPPVVVIYATEE